LPATLLRLQAGHPGVEPVVQYCAVWEDLSRCAQRKSAVGVNRPEGRVVGIAQMLARSDERQVIPGPYGDGRLDGRALVPHPKRQV